MTTGLDDTPRNRIAHAAQVHGWDWQGWGHVATISRGSTSIRIVFSRAGNIVRAFNRDERYFRIKVSRNKGLKVVDQIIRDLGTGSPAGYTALLRR